MSDYRSNATYEQLAGRIRAADRILLTTHAKPDGDGMGSALALARALRTMGKHPHVYMMGPLESRLLDVADDTPFELATGKPPSGEFDLVIVLDTGAWAQLDPIADWLRERHDRVIGLDHHARGDDVAAMRVVNSKAPSTTAMLIPLLEALGCEITGGPGGIAEALFVGLATDTGWFRYSNADAGALRLAADLLDKGVDKSRLFHLIEETFRPQRLALQARALASLEFACNGAVAIMTLRPDDFRDTGGKVEDTSELINTPMSVKIVRASILLAQTRPGQTKASFRSKPSAEGFEGELALDMNVLARRFGGGGHIHASGATLEMDVDEARERLLAAVEEMVKEKGLRDKGTEGLSGGAQRGRMFRPSVP